MPRADPARRVLMTADAVGGVWTYAMELCAALGERGVAVTLAVMGPPPSSAQLAEAAGIPRLDLHARDYRLEWMEDPWPDIAAAGGWLLNLARRSRPDVIHLNGFAHAALRWPAPVAVVGHSCVRSWWRGVHGTDPPPKWQHYVSTVAAGLHAADVVVAPSAAMLEALRQCYGPIPNGRVILNGRRACLGAETRKQPFVLTAGRLWDAAKNVRAVCAAAPGLRWGVEVAGPTEQEGVDGALSSTVRYLGHLDHAAVRSRMAAAAIYALPARYEPFGLSVLEAALAGCVLVLGDIPSLREIWGDCALFVPPDDAGALATAINALSESPDRRILLAARARRRAAALTPERMAGAYAELYEELVLRASDSAPRSKRPSAANPRMLTPSAPSPGGRGQNVPRLPLILDTSR